MTSLNQDHDCDLEQREVQFTGVAIQIQACCQSQQEAVKTLSTFAGDRLVGDFSRFIRTFGCSKPLKGELWPIAGCQNARVLLDLMLGISVDGNEPNAVALFEDDGYSPAVVQISDRLAEAVKTVIAAAALFQMTTLDSDLKNGYQVAESLVTVAPDWCREPLREGHLPVVNLSLEASDGVHLVETELCTELVTPIEDTAVWRTYRKCSN